MRIYGAGTTYWGEDCEFAVHRVGTWWVILSYVERNGRRVVVDMRVRLARGRAFPANLLKPDYGVTETKEQAAYRRTVPWDGLRAKDIRAIKFSEILPQDDSALGLLDRFDSDTGRFDAPPPAPKKQQGVRVPDSELAEIAELYLAAYRTGTPKVQKAIRQMYADKGIDVPPPRINDRISLAKKRRFLDRIPGVNQGKAGYRAGPALKTWRRKEGH